MKDRVKRCILGKSVLVVFFSLLSFWELVSVNLSLKGSYWLDSGNLLYRLSKVRDLGWTEVECSFGLGV